MSLSINKFFVGKSQAETTSNLPKIAELLGLNYNTENSIMYKGDDDTTGFKIDADSSNLHLYLASKGAVNSTSITNFAHSYGIYLYYYKTADGTVVFGFNTGSNPPAIFASCAKIKNISDEIIEEWAYLYGSRSTNVSDYYIASSLWSEVQLTKVLNYESSFNVVTFVPFIFIIDGTKYFKFDKIFRVFTKVVSIDTETFILNNKPYIISALNSVNNYGGYSSFAIQIEEE